MGKKLSLIFSSMIFSLLGCDPQLRINLPQELTITCAPLSSISCLLVYQPSSTNNKYDLNHKDSVICSIDNEAIGGTTCKAEITDDKNPFCDPDTADVFQNSFKWKGVGAIPIIKQVTETPGGGCIVQFEY